MNRMIVELLLALAAVGLLLEIAGTHVWAVALIGIAVLLRLQFRRR